MYTSHRKRLVQFGKLGSLLLALLWVKRQRIVIERKPELTVVIPAIYSDLSTNALSGTLASIRQQTHLPDEIIVRVSSCNETLQTREVKRLHSVVQPIRLRVLSTRDQQNPGQNRNVASAVATGDFVSFFDSDDVMHPERIHIIRKLFMRNPSLDIVIHCFATSKTQETWSKVNVLAISYVGKTVVCENERRSRAAGTLWLDHSGSGFRHTITHGHVSVRRSVLEHHQFGDARTGEDCVFVRNVLQEICSSGEREAILVDEPLTLYEPRSTRQGKPER